VHVEQTWQAIKDYQEKAMKLKETDKDKLYFDHHNPEDLQRIIDMQHKVRLHMQNLHQLYVILVIIDDFSDDQHFSRHNTLVHSLSTRGMHSSISTVVNTRKNTAVAQIIRIKGTSVCVYRLRNQQMFRLLFR
jgi:hypothetical protein